MKPKHLFFIVFVFALFLAAKLYAEGHELVALLCLAMAGASALNASRPGANRRASFRELIDLFVKTK